MPWHPCNRPIHTLGMHVPIDVIFIHRNWHVHRICRNIHPGRFMVWGGWHGLQALEVSAGWLDVVDIHSRTQLEWQCIRTVTATKAT